MGLVPCYSLFHLTSCQFVPIHFVSACLVALHCNVRTEFSPLLYVLRHCTCNAVSKRNHSSLRSMYRIFFTTPNSPLTYPTTYPIPSPPYTPHNSLHHTTPYIQQITHSRLFNPPIPPHHNPHLLPSNSARTSTKGAEFIVRLRVCFDSLVILLFGQWK